MEQKLIDSAPLLLLFMPVCIAIIGIINNFNVVDFVYLVLVGVLFLKYFVVIKKQK